MTRRLPLSEIACRGLLLGLIACERLTPPPPATSTLPQFPPTPPPSPTASVASFDDPGSAIRTALAQAKNGPDLQGEERRALALIYPATSESPLWLDANLGPSGNAQEALAALREAASEGLDPADYRADELSARAFTLATAPAPPHDIAAFDVALTVSMMRYLRHLHRGRVDPRAIGFHLALPRDEHDYGTLVREAVAQSGIKSTVASMTPPLVQYRHLRSVLPRYRALASDPLLLTLPAPPGRSVKPGDASPSLDLLRARLIAMGDLPESAASLEDATLYEGELVEGVRRFQARHGLPDDGVLGKATWAALGVPLSWRARQVELAMERMRWLPHLGDRPFVAVNIPMFKLWVWENVPESGAPEFGMGVIVGKALNTRTPVFMEEMEHLIFQPYWNVPRSILVKEILPILRRDQGYLARQDLEMVDGPGDDGRPVAPTAENVELLAQGGLRLRQRPGRKNSLGQVKFMFPNDENVYLHGTPATELFGRARRDFSHGCVRVEDPLALAEWTLRDQPQWTREKILEAMNGTPSFRVPLTRPIRVVLYYVTAAVIPENNAIQFADDIYGHDSRLDRALRARKKAS